MKSVNIFFILFFVLLVVVPIGRAQTSSFEPLSNNYLSLTSNEKPAFKLGEEIIWRTYVLNTSQQLTGNDTNCYLRLYNSTNALTADISLFPSNDAYLNVLNSSVMSDLGKHDYVVFCNSSSQVGFVEGSFDVTVDGLTKDSAPTGLLAAIVLLPMLFGFLLLFWAHSLNPDEHGIFKIFLSLLSAVSIFVSLQFALVSIIKVYYFPALQEAIGSTVFWMGWMFVVFMFYFIIYIMVKAFDSMKKKKQENLRY